MLTYGRIFKQKYEAFVNAVTFLSTAYKLSGTDTEHNSSQILQNAVEQPVLKTFSLKPSHLCGRQKDVSYPLYFNLTKEERFLDLQSSIN